MIRGGIDGSSRMIVYLKAATNNKADTVLEEFMNAIKRYGLPSHIQCDKRGENMQVAKYMLENRGLN